MMKHIFFVIIIISFNVCYSQNDLKKTESSNEINSCEQFLKGYEKFMKDYIIMIEKVKKFPNDITITSDYAEMMIEAAVWTDFDENCANDPAFIGKYTEIQMKIATQIGNQNNEINNHNSEKLKSNNSDCNEFLNSYEKFMKEYISILKKYKANAADASILSDYSRMMIEAAVWTDFDESCANDPVFVGKYTEIQMKIASAVAEN